VLRLQRAAKLVKVYRALPANEVHTCVVCVILIVSLSKTPFNAADSVAERGYRQYSLVPWLVFSSPPPTSLPMRQKTHRERYRCSTLVPSSWGLNRASFTTLAWEVSIAACRIWTKDAGCRPAGAHVLGRGSNLERRLSRIA
jgi:hypothetical protein